MATLPHTDHAQAIALARAFTETIDGSVMSPTNQPLLAMLACPRAMDVFVSTTSTTSLGWYPITFAHALVVAAHPAPWKFTPLTPGDISGGAVQHILGIYHKLALDPSLAPDIPWLDSQLHFLLRQCGDYHVHGGPPITGSTRLYWNALCLVATRVGYVPSPRVAHAMDRAIATLEGHTNIRDPASASFLHAAEILARLGVLPDTVREYLQSQTISPALGHQLYLRNTILDLASFSGLLSSTSYIGLPNAPDAAMSELAVGIRGSHPLYNVYNLALLLPPTTRLTWLANERVAEIAPVLFALPLYAPSQFTAVSNDTWATALDTAHPTVKPLLLPLVSAVYAINAAATPVPPDPVSISPAARRRAH